LSAQRRIQTNHTIRDDDAIVVTSLQGVDVPFDSLRSLRAVDAAGWEADEGVLAFDSP